MFKQTMITAFSILICSFMLLATIGCEGQGPTSNSSDLNEISQYQSSSQRINGERNYENDSNNRNNNNRRYDFSNRNGYGRDNPMNNRNHDKPKNGHYPHNDSTIDLTTIITFEDVLQELPNYNMGSQHAIITFKNISWDHDGMAGGTGWGVYNTSNSQPYSGNNYVMNRHGKNFLGFTFPNVVRFKGAHFAKATSNGGMDPNNPSGHSAVKLKYHFYDENNNLISSTDWFDLQVTSELFAADVDVKRVVVEHDILNTTNAQFGVQDAEWFSMDDVMFVM